jgi:predicted DCC family thiol-disulfide oxidoreductase YuxK
MTPRAALLYDRNCGFCRWLVARILRRDRRGALLPVAIQSAEGHRLLAGVPEEQQLDTWHLVRADGTVLSGDEAMPEVLRPLRIRRREGASAVAGLGYRAVAAERPLIGRLVVTEGAIRRADELIAERNPHAAAAPVPPEPAAAPVPPEPAAAPVPPEPAAAPVPPEPVLSKPPAGAVSPSATPGATAGLTLQQRIEQSDFGRGLITAFLLATLIAIVVENLPNSAIRHHVMRPGQPYLNALGLDQNWGLFAPDPRRSVIDVYAIVKYDDGSTAVWRFPHNDALVGTYRDYRWRKWAENVFNTDNGVVLWRPAAVWAGRQMSRAGRQEQTVTLVRRWANLSPPGVSPSQRPWRSQSFFTLQLRQ